MIPREYVFENLKDISILRDFQCGISSMDAFIQDGLDLSIQNHYCNAYIVMENRKGSEILALFALSFDSLDLDIEDKNEVISGVSNAGIPQLTDNYKDVFLNKSHYPALEIAYLAVAKNLRYKGLGRIIIESIVQKAQEQELAGCQFLTVEALNTNEYSAVSFYNKCNFSACELPDPNKGTLRMFRTLYPVVK